MTSDVAARYRRFAQFEAHGRSDIYERLALHVAQSPAALNFLSRFPHERQQPNLFFAAIRFVCGQPADDTTLDDLLRQHASAIDHVMRTRTTQTNEPRRCASLLPAIAEIEGPIALIEIGASAGLCLLMDAYGYDWNGTTLHPPQSAEGPQAPILSCQVTPPVRLPSRYPDIVWRAGLDLNPLDATDSDDVAWLKTLVWPGDLVRERNLDAALAMARLHPPVIRKGNLLTDIRALIAEAPKGTQVIVFHTAVLSYITSQDDRNAFADEMRRTNAIWLSNEAPGVFPQFLNGQRARENLFLLAKNAMPIAWTGPHGQSLDWIG